MTSETSAKDGITVVRTFRNHLLELVTPREVCSSPSPEPHPAGPVISPTEEPLGAAIPAAPPPAAGPASPLRSTPTIPPPAASASAPTTQENSANPPGQVEGARKKLGLVELEKRYQHILDLYGEFGIPVLAPADAEERFVEGPATVLYRVRPGQAIDPKRLYEKADALKLALELGEEQSIRFSIDKGFVHIDIPKREEDRYFVSAKDLWSRWSRPETALAAPLGEDRYGGLVAINFSSSNSPHLLIGGTTGSGKSEALNTILMGLVTYYSPEELKLLLIDPKGTELQGFAKSPHLDGRMIGLDDEDAKDLLKEAVEEMQSRYKLLKQHGLRSLSEFNASAAAGEKMPWWVLVLDEYADLTSDADAKKDIEASLRRLAQKARAAGIHVIIATQKPSADVISTNLRSNLPAQLALRVRSGIESRVIMEESGAETLNGKGDAFLKSEGRLNRVQCARV